MGAIEAVALAARMVRGGMQEPEAVAKARGHFDARFPEYASSLEAERFLAALRNVGRKGGTPGFWPLVADLVNQAGFPGLNDVHPKGETLRKEWADFAPKDLREVLGV
jgi:hypothetical protein